MLASHTKSSYSLLFARFIERGMYYGIRAIIVIYAITNYDISRTEAISWYGLFTGTYYVAQFLGGVITDLLLKSKISILIGGILQVIGVLLFMIPDYEVFKVAGIVFSVGSGLYSVNIVSVFGKLYVGRSELLASGFTLFYMLVNAGIFLGVLLLPLLAVINGYLMAFLIIAVLLAASTSISFFFTSSEIPQVKRIQSAPKGKGVFLIILGAIILNIFLIPCELTNASITSKSIEVNRAFNGSLGNRFNLEYFSYTLMIAGVLLFLLWKKAYVSNILKIGIAFSLAGIAYYSMLIQMENMDSLYKLILFHTISLAIAEILIIPSLLSIYASYSHPKYLTLIYGSTVFAGFILFSLPSFYGWGFIDYPDNLVFKITAYSLFGVGALFLLLNQFLKDKSPYELVTETSEKEIELKEGDLLD